MFSALLLIACVALALFKVYKWLRRNDDYFKDRGIPYLRPTLFFGNHGALVLGKCTVFELIQNIYKSQPNERLFGFFEFMRPTYMVRDPVLIRRLTIKEFDYFPDHRGGVDGDTDELFGNGLLMMKGEKWRQMRATMSPAFTGSKMRQMFELLSDTADEMIQFLKKKSNAGESIEDEVKDICMKYTNDAMASCAFGIKVNSFENDQNEFLKAGKDVIDLGSIKTFFRGLLITTLPRLARLLKIQIFKSDFYKRMVLETIEERKKLTIYRPDLINIMMQIRQGDALENAASAAEDERLESNDGLATVEESHIGKMKVHRKWTDNELVAQCFLFYFGGFDFVSGTLALTIYALALNQDVQDKLYEEIRETDERIGGKRLDYESMQKMKYLDQVVCETLRMWPAIPTGDRECAKDYAYDDGEFSFKLSKGETITFPIVALHYDEKYFNEPHKFNPDRFSPENKDQIVPGTFLPFGSGPRNCIGSRLALMELKAIIYYLILNFSLAPNAKTEIPLKFKKGSPFGLVTENGIYVDFNTRK